MQPLIFTFMKENQIKQHSYSRDVTALSLLFSHTFVDEVTGDADAAAEAGERAHNDGDDETHPQPDKNYEFYNRLIIVLSSLLL